MNHTTHSKGEVAQLRVELEALNKGYLVSKPTRHESRYDCILDDGVRLIKTQVKYANGHDKRSSGSIIVPLRKSHKNRALLYDEKDVDLVLVFVPSIDKVLALKPEHFHNKQNFCIRLVKPKNNHQGTFNWFEDFVW